MRAAFSRRLREVRSGLGYTQQQMAYALGIQPARDNKYEIGRSEAPYDVLFELARIAKVDLDYLLLGRSGGRRRTDRPAGQSDRQHRLLAHNQLYRAMIADGLPPRLLRPGTPGGGAEHRWLRAGRVGPKLGR